MRVLHVIPAVAPRYGGPTTAVFGMSRAVAARGAEVLIATTDADGETRLPVPVGQPTRYRGCDVVFFRRSWSEAFKYSRGLAVWLRDSAADFDIVHIHGVFSHSSWAAAGACRARHIPYVVRPLGSLAIWSLGQKRRRKRLFLAAVGRRMIGDAAAVHYTAPQEQREAEQALRLRRGVVIPLGVDDEILTGGGGPSGDFRAAYPDLGTSPYVLMLGRLHPKKGVEVLVEGFLRATSEARLANWRLVIAGDGDAVYKEAVERRARSGRGRVILTGWIDGQRRVDALRGASLLALPSRQENFGLAAMEALACGVPVLTSPAVNLADEIVAAGAGWVVDVEAGSIARALGGIMDGEAERQARGEAGRRLVRARYTWQAVAGRLSELYTSAIEAGRATR